jgi:hypothetical protein
MHDRIHTRAEFFSPGGAQMIETVRITVGIIMISIQVAVTLVRLKYFRASPDVFREAGLRGSGNRQPVTLFVFRMA